MARSRSIYEPFESPVANPLHPQQSNNPVVKKYTTDMDKYGTTGEGFTIICTTYRLTEHYHYWTKNNPMNVQLVPQMFVEIPVELAGELGIKGGRNGEGHQRPRDLSRKSHGHATHPADDDRRQEGLSDRHPHPSGLPGHSGRRRQGAAQLANLLSPTVTDPNAYTPEFKGFLVKLEKA